MNLAGEMLHHMPTTVAFDRDQLAGGDRARIIDHDALRITAGQPTELVLVDVPLHRQPIGVWASLSLMGKRRGARPVARAQELAAAAQAAGRPSSPAPPGTSAVGGRMWTAMSNGEVCIRPQR